MWICGISGNQRLVHQDVWRGYGGAAETCDVSAAGADGPRYATDNATGNPLDTATKEDMLEGSRRRPALLLGGHRRACACALLLGGPRSDRL